MAIDPRLELARRMAAGQGGYSGGGTGGGSLQQEAAARFAALKNKKTQTKKEEGPGGWKGLVSAALDNPIAKTALAPLMVLDYGRSGLVSGVQELADIVDGNKDTKGSFGDLFNQTKNHIGFGDIKQFKTNNKWLDRLIGFTGDVALDPLTYLTLGVGTTANLGSRVGLAAQVAEKGAAKVAAQQITQQGLDNIVSKVGKNGLAKLSPAERAMFDLPEAGLYFGRPFAKEAGKGVLIPGTGRIGAKLSSGLGSTKNAILASKPITKITTGSDGLLRKAPEGLEEAFTKLATGKGRISTTQAAAVISGHTKKAAVGAAFTNTWARAADGLLNDVSKDEAARVALTHALEAGDLSNSVTAASRKWYDDVRSAFMESTGKTVDDIGYRDNYVPHVWGEEGRAVLAGDTEVAQDLRKVMTVSVDEVQKAGPTFERKIEAGTYKIAGKDITFNTGTIDEINGVLSREFPDLFKTGKALEDDSLKLMGHYANAMGRGVGDDAFIKRLTTMGVAKGSGDAMHLVKDVGETKAANKVLHQEILDEIKVTNTSIKQAKASAHVSMKAAVEHVGNVVKQKLATMTGRSAALKTQFDELAVKLSSDAVDFDSKMALLIDAETAARIELDAAVLRSEGLQARYADEIAAVEQAGKEADKARLVAYREAKKAIADADANVVAIQTQLDAYNTLKETAGKLNDDIKTMVEGVQFKDLPDEARKAAQTRTVAKQQSIDSAATKGADEATQVVPLGSGMNESFGLMKKIKFEVKAVGSALRQTVDAAGAHVGEAYHAEIAAIHDMIDQAATRVAPGTNQALDKATRAVGAAEDRVANLRLQLEGARASGRSASTIAKWEGRLADAERGLGVARQEADAIGGSEVKSVLTFDETMPGAGRDAKFNQIPKAALEEQFNKQIQFAKNALMKKVFDETAATLGVDAATKNSVVVDNLVRSFEVAARARVAPSGSASAVAAAQMALEESVTNARIATDFAKRLKSVTQIIEQSGQTLTPVQTQAVENMVMREVLTTEREAMQEKVRQLTSSMEHYAAQEGGVTTKVNLAKTKAANAGKKRANETWDILRLYLDEIFATREEAGLRSGAAALGASDDVASIGERELFGKVAEGATQPNSGFSVYTPGGTGQTTRAQQQAFRQVRDDLKKAISDILFEGDRVGAKEYLRSGQLDRLLNKISSGYGPEAQAAWTEEFQRIYLSRNASTINKSNRTSGWLATAAKGAEKEVELLNEQILQTNRLIQRLRPTGSGVNTIDNQSTVAFFESQAKVFGDRVARLRAAGTFQGEEYRQAKYYFNLFDGVAKERAATGIPKGAPRLTAGEVLSGKVRPSGVSAVNKQLKATREALVIAEQEMERIVTTGALKDAVKEVPGRANPFNKAKQYIALLDSEIGVLKVALKRQPAGPERSATLKRVLQMNKEKLRLQGLIQTAEPLEDRLISAKVVLQQAKDDFKGLQTKAALKAETAGKVQGLRTQRDAMMVGENIVQAGKAGQIVQAEVAKETLRETYDATVAATRDALGTIDTARNEIDSLIPAVEQLVRDTPKVGKGMLRDDVVEQIEWLSDAYDMMDPQTLTERLFNMPGDMTPDMLKAGRTNTGITNPELVAFLRSLPTDPSSNTALALIYQAHKDQGRLFTLMGEKEALKVQAQMAKDGNLITVMKRVAKDGLQELADSGIFVPPEVAAIMTKIVEIDNVAAGEIREALMKYTEIWKAVKTTSPRFHIRNAMSATFMNYVADVKTRNMIKGVEYWRLFEQDPLNWLDNIPAAERQYAKAALEDVFGSGGGQYSEVAMANSKISNMGIFKMSKEKGVQVEGYVRMGMALDSRLPAELGGKGLEFDQSVARITKFHFNYSQLSKLDRNAKMFIPFWTFMSRNLPLQIEQMWMNPRTYAIYKSFVRNANDDQEGDIVPKYIKEIGGFKLPFGEDLYATPDIGMNRVQQDIAQFRDPLRLGQNLNPLFKTPLEYWAGKQFYKDIPLRDDKYVPLRGAGKLVQPFGELFGGVERSSDGTPTMSQKNFYAGMQLIPGLQELERLVAPGQENYKDKQGMSLLNFLTGAPVAKVTQSARDSERERMKRELAKRKATKKAVNKGARE
jgi:hypothetical protein